MPHCDSELHRFDRAVLADRFQEILELADQLEGQPGRIAGPEEQARRKRSTGFGGRRTAPTRLRLTVGRRWSRSGQIRILWSRLVRLCLFRARTSIEAPCTLNRVRSRLRAAAETRKSSSSTFRSTAIASFFMEKVFKRRLSHGARDAAAEKPRSGTTGASAALPACRSDRRMCIVGGRNDAADIMRQF